MLSNDWNIIEIHQTSALCYELYLEAKEKAGEPMGWGGDKPFDCDAPLQHLVLSHFFYISIWWTDDVEQPAWSCGWKSTF